MVTKPAKKSPPRKAQPRKAAPRRAARTRAAGATSGDPTPVNGAGVAPAPGEDAQVRESALPQDNSGVIKSPYGDRPTYTFFPQLETAGLPQAAAEALLAPIIFPKFTSVHAPRKWLWKVYDKGPLIQAFEWMKLAGVPRDVQERVIDLPDAEYERFWDGWFGEARIAPGE